MECDKGLVIQGRRILGAESWVSDRGLYSTVLLAQSVLCLFYNSKNKPNIIIEIVELAGLFVDYWFTL